MKAINVRTPVFVLTLAMLVACSEGGEVDEDQPGTVADFNGEVYRHSAWNDLSPDMGRSNSPTGLVETGIQEIVGDDEYLCDTTQYSMTDMPSEFISMQPDSSIVWLGNLIQGDSHLKVGSLAELSIDDRAPLNISVDLLFNDNSRTIPDPSLTTVNAAIGSMIASAISDGVEGPVDAFYEEKEAHSTYQTALELGFTAEYLGASAQANLEVEKRGAEKSHFAYFIQKAFTVSMELPTSPQDLVNDQFSDVELEALIARGQIGTENPPLYISGITYGKILIYKITASYESERISAAIRASYEGLEGSASGFTEAEIQETLANSEIEITSVGGNQESIEGLIRSGQLASYFTGNTNLNQYRPISFELRNARDNTIASISRTTEYDVKQCQYVGTTAEPVGEQTKITLLSVTIPADCDLGADPGDIFGYFNVISHNPTTNADYTRAIYNRNRNAATPIASGTVWNFGIDYTINQYYGTTFQLSGRLMDSDSGANGADDKVGDWDGNRNSIAGKQPGTYSSRATRNCSGNPPTLRYNLERLQYLY
ncbi:MAG: thiol-activated cytolysin family protein [Granulosicoccus sp.]